MFEATVLVSSRFRPPFENGLEAQLETNGFSCFSCSSYPTQRQAFPASPNRGDACNAWSGRSAPNGGSRCGDGRGEAMTRLRSWV